MSLMKKFDVIGRVKDLPHSGRPVTATTAEYRALVVHIPQKSTKRFSIRLGVSQMRIKRM